MRAAASSSRAMAGVERFVNGGVERAATPHEHGQPDQRQRDERGAEPDVGGALADR